MSIVSTGVTARSRLDNESDLIVFAHRGVSKDYPENTLPAFRRAVELEVDFIETDIHFTKDGRFAVIHDDSIDRITDGRGRVIDYTLSELRECDAGFNFTEDGGKTYPFRGRGIKLMSLDEILEKFPEQKFNLDLKDNLVGQVEPFIQIINEHGACNRIIAASKHHAVLKVLRKRCPAIPTSFSTREVLWIFILFKCGFLRLKRRFKGVAIQIPAAKWGIRPATGKFVSILHSRNLQVHLWTVNDEEAMRKYIDMGIDGIMSDDPELLLGVSGR